MTLVTPLEPPPVRRKDAPRGRSLQMRHAVRLTPWVRLDMAVASARGARREVNEDWHSTLDEAAPLFVVADGVGGGAMASRASRELVLRLHQALGGRHLNAPAIRDAVLDADRGIGRSIASRTSGSGAATVALCAGVGMLLSKWHIGWVGDCRVYRIAADPQTPAQLLTVDDTYRHLHEDAPPGSSLDDPARMVGNGAVSAPNVAQTVLRRGEMLVLCSDGVHKHVDTQLLSDVLRGSGPPERRCSRLLALARAGGSRDDATVLVVQREIRRARLAWLGAGWAMLAGLLVLALFAALKGAALT